ncbi:MAG: lysophospholipid acyltransferase family protein [Polyangiales bacterium]
MEPTPRLSREIDPDLRLVGALRLAARVVRAVHPTRLEGADRLPAGPALLVGNHGFLGYETLLFFERLYAETGRLPRGLADRWFFRVPLLRDLLRRVGGVRGSPDHAQRALSAGHLVVCYPGGAREVLKHDPSTRYRLQWEKSAGFVRVALRGGVPIVPFAAAGVDDTFDVVRRLEGSGELLMGHAKYDLPLPATPLPRPVPFWFRIGEPIVVEGDADDDARVSSIHAEVWRRTQSLLDDLVAEYRCAS